MVERVKNPKAIIHEMIVEGDRVAYEWSWSGLIDGVETKTVGMTILHLKDGKIIKDRVISAEVKEQEAVA